jgi:SAM-dependent methyltransferase
MPRPAPAGERSTHGPDRPPAADPYAIPLLYDVLHTPGTSHEVRALERIARRFVRPPAEPFGAWLEPACGTGRYLRLAARRVRLAVGFDHSPGMIEYARIRVAGVPRPPRYFVASMQDFDRHLPRGSIDFAFNLINTIRHLESDADMLAHLAAVARVLRPGGAYAVGLSLCAYGRESPTEDVWRGVRGRLRVTQTIQYLPPAVPSRARRNHAGRFERVISHLHVVRGRSHHHHDATYRLRAYDLAQWLELIARSPLRLTATVDEDGRDAPPCEPGYAVYLLAHATR